MRITFTTTQQFYIGNIFELDGSAFIISDIVGDQYFADELSVLSDEVLVTDIELGSITYYSEYETL